MLKTEREQEDDPNSCPRCKSSYIFAHPPVFAGIDVEFDNECEDCDFEWKETYTMQSVKFKS